MQPSILSDSRASYVIKLQSADFPEHNSKKANTLNQYRRGKEK